MESPLKSIRKKPIWQMKYDEMTNEIINVRKCLKERFLDITERSDLRKYVRKLEKEVYDYEKFRGIPHTTI